MIHGLFDNMTARVHANFLTRSAVGLVHTFDARPLPGICLDSTSVDFISNA